MSANNFENFDEEDTQYLEPGQQLMTPESAEIVETPEIVEIAESQNSMNVNVDDDDEQEESNNIENNINVNVHDVEEQEEANNIANNRSLDSDSDTDEEKSSSSFRKMQSLRNEFSDILKNRFNELQQTQDSFNMFLSEEYKLEEIIQSLKRKQRSYRRRREAIFKMMKAENSFEVMYRKLYNCLICCEENIEAKNMYFLNCSHTICKKCYNRIEENKCPNCRHELTVLQIIKRAGERYFIKSIPVHVKNN